MRTCELEKEIGLVAEIEVITRESKDPGEQVVQIVEEGRKVAVPGDGLDEFPHLVLVFEGIAEDVPLHDLARFAEQAGEEERGADRANHQRDQAGEERIVSELITAGQPEDEHGAQAGEKDEEHADRFGCAPVERHVDVEQLILQHAVPNDQPVENRRHASEGIDLVVRVGIAIDAEDRQNVVAAEESDRHLRHNQRSYAASSQGGSERRCQMSTATDTQTRLKMTLKIQKPVPATEYHA